MKKIWAFVFILLFVVGCSNEDNMNQIVTKYENQIENQRKENQELKEENEQLKTDLADYETQLADYSTDLKVGDVNSRRIMRLISEGKFEEVKKEFNAEFEVKDGKIYFDTPKDNEPFHVDLAGYPMSISLTHRRPNGGRDIAYYIYAKDDNSHLIYMTFDKDWNFETIFVGDK